MVWLTTLNIEWKENESWIKIAISKTVLIPGFSPKNRKYRICRSNKTLWSFLLHSNLHSFFWMEKLFLFLWLEGLPLICLPCKWLFSKNKIELILGTPDRNLFDGLVLISEPLGGQPLLGLHLIYVLPPHQLKSRLPAEVVDWLEVFLQELKELIPLGHVHVQQVGCLGSSHLLVAGLLVISVASIWL